MEQEGKECGIRKDGDSIRLLGGEARRPEPQG